MQKLKPQDRRQRISATVSPAIKRFYDKLPDKIRSQFIENAILKYLSVCDLQEIIDSAVTRKPIRTIPEEEIKHADNNAEYIWRGNDIQKTRTPVSAIAER